MSVFVLVFTYVVPIRIPRYPLYLLTGFLVWNNFYASLSDCTWSIRRGGDLLKKVSFPPEVFPLSAAMTNLITLCLSLFVLVPFLAIYEIQPTYRLGYLPGIILWQVLFCMGLGMILALFHVYFYDTAPLLEIVLNLWFYATPIFYSTDILPEKIKMFYYLNPMAILIGLYRWAILSLPPPPLFQQIVWAVATVGLLLLGFLLYEKRGSQLVKSL